jgi:hypothetical protein
MPEHRWPARVTRLIAATDWVLQAATRRVNAYDGSSTRGSRREYRGKELVEDGGTHVRRSNGGRGGNISWHNIRLGY